MQYRILERKRKGKWDVGKGAVLCLVTRSCPMDCSPPASSVHAILQARILEWVAMPSSRGPTNPGIEPRPFALQEDCLPSEPLRKGAAAAKSLRVQLCARQPTRLRHPWDSPGKKEHWSGSPFPSPMHESKKGK